MLTKHLKISFLFVLSLWLFACASSQGAGFQLNAQLEQTGKNIQVKGHTNLPDKAIILVSWLDPNKKADFNENVVVQEFALAQGGSFSVLLKPHKSVPAGKYVIRLRFAPNSYDPSGGKVTAAVGPKGEKLTGPQVFQDGDVKMLVNLLEMNYQ